MFNRDEESYEAYGGFRFISRKVESCLHFCNWRLRRRRRVSPVNYFRSYFRVFPFACFGGPHLRLQTDRNPKPSKKLLLLACLLRWLLVSHMLSTQYTQARFGHEVPACLPASALPPYPLPTPFDPLLSSQMACWPNGHIASVRRKAPLTGRQAGGLVWSAEGK